MDFPNQTSDGARQVLVMQPACYNRFQTVGFTKKENRLRINSGWLEKKTQVTLADATAATDIHLLASHLSIDSRAQRKKKGFASMPDHANEAGIVYDSVRRERFHAECSGFQDTISFDTELGERCEVAVCANLWELGRSYDDLKKAAEVILTPMQPLSFNGPRHFEEQSKNAPTWLQVFAIGQNSTNEDDEEEWRR